MDYFFTALFLFQYVFIAALLRIFSRAFIASCFARMSPRRIAAGSSPFAIAFCARFGSAAVAFLQHRLHVSRTCNWGRQKDRMPLVLLHCGQVLRGLSACIDVVSFSKGYLWAKCQRLYSLRPLRPPLSTSQKNKRTENALCIQSLADFGSVCLRFLENRTHQKSLQDKNVHFPLFIYIDTNKCIYI